MNIIEINGEAGGGQILRSALSLSMITGQGFRMVNIRGKRSKSGLMRQHLTCVKAAAEVCSAIVNKGSGAALHDMELEFHPGEVKSGDYMFKIGSAGSTTLLFQTLFPALMLAENVSTIEVHGGTHNPMAPTADFIERSFLPQMKKMGAVVNFKCLKYGFAPAGGGCIRAEVHPVAELSGLSLVKRGNPVSKKIQCVLVNVPESVGFRELATAKSSLGWDDNDIELRKDDVVDGVGNLLSVEKEYENVVIHSSCCGMKAKSSERVATDTVKAYLRVENSLAVVDTRLADQLLLPFALAGSGELVTISMTNHIQTNVTLIEKFCPVKFTFKDDEKGMLKVVLSSKKEI